MSKAKIPEMTRHRGFPSHLSGTNWQFTIRRPNPKVTTLSAWPRHPSGDQSEALADAAFLHSVWHYFGPGPFVRGNLDAGRLSRLFGREIIPAGKQFDPSSYDALLQVNEKLARKNFPIAFEDVMEV